jgi:hypothetical protein
MVAEFDCEPVTVLEVIVPPMPVGYNSAIIKASRDINLELISSTAQQVVMYSLNMLKV